MEGGALIGLIAIGAFVLLLCCCACCDKKKEIESMEQR